MKVTDGLPCPVCHNNLRHYDDCPMLQRSEHLEPEIGAILQFQGMPDHLKRTEGHRWRLKEAHPHWMTGVLYYYLRRLNDSDDETATYLRADQDIMDRCGRLLMAGEEQAG